jgi:hypothetical protein
MITLYEFAQLAAQIYTRKHDRIKIPRGDSNLSTTHNHLAHSADGQWSEAILDRCTQANSARTHGFYASLFIKKQRQKPICAVIVIRGTNNWENVKQDIKSWWRSVFNSHAKVILPQAYMNQAKIFYFKVQRYCQQELELPNTRIYVTGHSLGGALSALLPTYFGFPIRAVTFNAPGIKDIAGTKPYWHRVINIRATYDFVSALDYPIGAQWNIPVPEHQAEAAQAFAIGHEHEINGWSRLNIVEDLVESIDFLASVTHQHSMKNLQQRLAIMAQHIGSLSATDVFGSEVLSVENVSSVRDSQPYDRLNPFKPKTPITV